MFMLMDTQRVTARTFRHMSEQAQIAAVGITIAAVKSLAKN
jgi:hypothetical protein